MVRQSDNTVARCSLAPATWLVVALVASGCVTESRRAVEAAIDEATQVTRSQLVSAAFVDVTVRAVDDGASDAKLLLAALGLALPCAAVSHPATGVLDTDGSPLTDTSRVTVSFPAADADAGVDACAVRGIPLEGAVTVSLVDASGDPRSVALDWDGLTDGVATLGGSSAATWSADSETRTVSPSSVWTRNDGSETQVGGSRTEVVPSAGDFATFDGSRCAAENTTEVLDCSTAEGLELCRNEDTTDCTTVASESTEVRWGAPLPDAGRHTVELPDKTQVLLRYTRRDEAIEVVGEAGGDEFLFTVTVAADE